MEPSAREAGLYTSLLRGSRGVDSGVGDDEIDIASHPARSGHPLPYRLCPDTERVFLLAPATCPGALLAAPRTLEAQSVTASVAAGVGGLSTSGSVDTFKSQFFMGEGFFLDDFSLSARGADGREKLNVSAWGFAGAEPAEAARIHWLPNGNRWYPDGHGHDPDVFVGASSTRKDGQEIPGHRSATGPSGVWSTLYILQGIRRPPSSHDLR